MRDQERIRSQDTPPKLRTEDPLEQGKQGDRDRMSERESPSNVDRDGPAQRQHDDDGDELVRSGR